jgi:hypothetical protein
MCSQILKKVTALVALCTVVAAHAVPRPKPWSGTCQLNEVEFSHSDGPFPDGPMVPGATRVIDRSEVALFPLYPQELVFNSAPEYQFRVALSGNGDPHGYAEIRARVSKALVDLMILQWSPSQNGEWVVSQEFTLAAAGYNYQISCKIDQ